MIHSALKETKTSEIERAVATAISNLLGQKYGVQIKEIAFGKSRDDLYYDRANLVLFMWREPEESKSIDEIVESFLKDDPTNVVEIPGRKPDRN